jgi:hypothetical protein
MSVSGRHSVAVRRLSGLALGVLSLVVVGAGLAWACTPQARLFVTPAKARAGGEVTVRGTNYPQGEAVRIRWNGPRGERLGTAHLPDNRDDFQTTVRIPAEAAPGAHIILGVPSSGVRRFGDNKDAGRTSIAVEPASRAGNPPVGGGPTRPGRGEPNRPGRGEPNGPGRGEPNRTDRGRTATSPGTRDLRGRGDRGEPNRPDRGRSGTSPGARDTGGRSGRGSAVSIPEGRSAPGVGAGPEVFPGSLAPTGSGTDGSPSPGTAPGDRESSGGRSVWKRPRAGEAPSLTPDRDDEEAATAPQLSARLAIGAGLLGFGLVALFAGFAVADVRRRRLAVQPSHRTPK